MKATILFTLSVLGCVNPLLAAGEEEECDLRTLSPTIGGRMTSVISESGKVEIVSIPDGPLLMACDCEIDEWLRTIESKDPRADAAEAAAADEYALWGRPILGGLAVVGLGDRSIDGREAVEVRKIPGTSDEVACYEQERLTIIALEYAGVYNLTIVEFLDLAGSAIPVPSEM